MRRDITAISLLVFLIVMEADAQLCITSLYILDILKSNKYSLFFNMLQFLITINLFQGLTMNSYYHQTSTQACYLSIYTLCTISSAKALLAKQAEEYNIYGFNY